MSEAVREIPKKQRREFRNIHITELSNYRMTLASIVSILHRISGFIMFVALPLVLYMLQQSLLSEDTFKHFAGIASHPLAKLVILGLAWAYFQHFCAGVRHLFMDLHLGLDKDSARQSSVGVLSASVLLTFLTALKLFGVF
ncbi:succinate dehydrogenase, cytochrome b556 subunit [Massilia psychrophila]|jgi:succinate dehydrogenase / fumarate reductase cytochrome b subunit|uniref:Succinate dehydrogenase cytochrome b556 subunit n=1 Tax=Massilia psychrophila TaxID=1603353 RepID=A0A2G8T3U2_9BURK|nr:succinate dehydrogenase, cytochrome b556 subunit [Massilia psychrophila]PIL40720.1 succinate dehydrogenase, cytochrome b556 subunit [Massilia psychrophila]GGE64341.1 succinate dehydrogenase cytochrome b-556 subunit [Massilia psychrophila]